jgi:carboxyl-terminal processing protease
VKRNEEGMKKSDALIRTQLKALVARDLWNSTAYYLVINDINQFMSKSLESLEDKTFEKMKIAGN